MPETFDSAAEFIISHMKTVVCPADGEFIPTLAVFQTPDGPGLVPDCCCCLTAFATFYSFDAAWAKLPESDRPRRSRGLRISLGESNDMPLEEVALFRLEWRDKMQEDLNELAYCEHHTITNAEIEIIHRDDGYSHFEVRGCCARFIEAAKFFMAIYMRPASRSNQ